MNVKNKKRAIKYGGRLCMLSMLTVASLCSAGIKETMVVK